MYKTFKLVNKLKNYGKIALPLIRFLGSVLPGNLDLFSVAASVEGLECELFQVNNVNLRLEIKAKKLSTFESLKSVLNYLVWGVSP